MFICVHACACVRVCVCVCVCVCKVDCSDRNALLQSSELASLGNVVGVMHLAGALADGLLAGMDR